MHNCSSAACTAIPCPLLLCSWQVPPFLPYTCSILALDLTYTSAILPLDLRYSSPIPLLYLRYISVLVPLYFRSISAIHHLYLHYTPLIHYLSLLYGKVIATPYLSRIKGMDKAWKAMVSYTQQQGYPSLHFHLFSIVG